MRKDQLPEMEMKTTITKIANQMERTLLTGIPMGPASLYIAGPMAGIEDFNYPAFFAVEEALNGIGIETVNPAAMDKAEGWTGQSVSAIQRAALLKRDFHEMTTVEGIVLLEGWEDSIGANAELMVAQISGMTTWLWIKGTLYPEPNLTADMDLVFGHINNVVWGQPVYD